MVRNHLKYKSALNNIQVNSLLCNVRALYSLGLLRVRKKHVGD